MITTISIPDIDLVKKGFISKILSANFNSLPISDYSKVYLKNIQSQIEYVTEIYSTILLKAIQETGKNVKDIYTIDYGGGTGLLSVFAKMCGIGNVIYNDIYNVSCRDVVHTFNELKLKPDDIIEGDIKDIYTKIPFQVDMIVSMDVIEHIYDLEGFFSVCGQMNPKLVMVHYTGANMYNAIINRRLKKQHRMVEHKGVEKKYGHKELDTIRPFFQIRKEIIKENFPQISKADLENYAKKTRGFNKKDIITSITKKIADPSFKIKSVTHPTNTCDPFTGNWEEHLVSIKEYKILAKKNGFNLKVMPSLYNIKQKSFKVYPLSVLNTVTKIFKTPFTAPGFYLTFNHKK